MGNRKSRSFIGTFEHGDLLSGCISSRGARFTIACSCEIEMNGDINLLSPALVQLQLGLKLANHGGVLVGDRCL
jgi:hypothetical protein